MCTSILPGYVVDATDRVYLQYFDFSTSFVTQFVLMHSADNFIESVHISVTEGLAKALFVFCCVVGGGFLINALLISVFMSSYEDDQAVVTEQPKLKRQRSLVAALEIWARHSIYSQAVYGIERNRHPTAAYSEFAETDLCFDTFLDLLLMGNSLGWVASMKVMAAQVVQLQLEIGKSSRQTHAVLLNIAAELSLPDLYEQLRDSQTEPFSARREAVLLSQQTLETSTHCSYQEVSWLRGRSPQNEYLQRAVYALPVLLGLEAPQTELAADDQNALVLYEATLRLVRLFYLQKWAVHRIYIHVNNMEEGNPRLRFQQLFRMCNAMDHMGESGPARVDSVRLAAEALLATLDDASDANSIGIVASDAKFVDDASKLMQISKLISREVVLKQDQLDASLVFDSHSEVNAAISQHARQLPFESLSSALYQGLFIWNDNKASQDQMVENLIVRFENQNRPASFDEFYRMRQHLKHLIVQENVNASHRVAFDLIREHAWLVEAGKPSERDFAVVGIGEVRLVFDLIAWASVLVLALYHSNDHADLFDALLVLFALLPWLEVCILSMRHGCRNYITCRKAPNDHLAVWGSLVCLGISLVGVVLLVSDSSFVASGTARCFTAFSALLVFTKNEKFYEMFLALTGVVRIAWPIVGLLLAVVCLYALLAVCIFIVMLGLICVCDTA